MGISSIIVVFFLTWWTMIFLVIPSANERQKEGALYPDKPNMVRKIVITTILSAVFTLAIWGIVRLDIISFRLWANEWE